MTGIQQIHLDLMRDVAPAIEPIIADYIKNKGLTLAEVVYCISSEADAIALRTVREVRKSKTK